MKQISIFLMVFIVTSAGIASADSFLVAKVVDEKTLRMTDGTQVKLLGVDPAFADSEETDEAIKFVRELVENKVVYLEYDIERLDEEGNVLSYVWILYPERKPMDELVWPANYVVKYRTFDSYWPEFYIFLNATLIKSGYAKPSQTPPHVRFSKEFDHLGECYLNVKECKSFYLGKE